MPTSNFDIYEAGDEYVAVTNGVRRRILARLEEGPSQLPELVELTGKSKSTLSSSHIGELLERDLVEAAQHPDDSRKKVYRLAGRKIGSSNVPLAQLRDAVKEYVSLSPGAARFPLSITVDALAAAPETADPEHLRAQARRLGLLVGQLLDVGAGRDRLLSIADMLEREGLAKAVRLDMEEDYRLVLQRGEAAPRETSIERVSVLVGGLTEGVLGDEEAGSRVEVQPLGEGETFSISIPPK